MTLRPLLGRLLAAAILLPGVAARAEEGMWPFEQAPLGRINADYGLALDQAWLDGLRAAAVRLNGCSGSVVSGQGLVLTNAHCVADCLQNLADAGEIEHADGFTEATREEEAVCPGQRADILVETRDVTEAIQAAGRDLVGAERLNARRRVEQTMIEQACAGDERHFCQVVRFHHGGRYVLYRYRVYRDVRLVFTPEPSVSGFGGDPDNFNFPRYALDFAFLRLYEDGRPAVTPDRLAWNPRGPREGQPVFVAGSPAWTQRQLTAAQLERMRDQVLPTLTNHLSEARGRLLQYAEADPDQAAAVAGPLAGVENNYKVYRGQLDALLDGALIATRRDEEAALRQAGALAGVEDGPDAEDPWAVIARAEAAARDLYAPYRQLEAGAGAGSSLYAYARAIVRSVTEGAKPEAERRPGYSDRDRARLAARLGAPRAFQPDIDRLYLTYWLLKTREALSVDDPNVQALLGDESPQALAERLVQGTGLYDAETRTALLAMTPEELAASGDPMIAFVLANDMPAQLARAQWELAVEAPTVPAQERIARARFAVHGDDIYPDATFTLRLSWGRVQGWTERRRDVPAFTDVAGLYDRATGADPFRLPDSWVQAREALSPDTPFVFVSTNDITGGNSGSPVVDSRGQLVGVAFDGNRHAIAGAFAYDGARNRTVSLTTTVMTEALRRVYGRTDLLKELGQR
ncbi:MAG TPA: S46 family peptidase [Brevundimonas sp.]|uniref:S46 family peptidase n=1 Tax=Brevundimonas sp. TaxID=1871086 RepID=UPI0026043C25|nr:S46 family peptidase [Brevundimonas sp.]HRO32567.1 S46 family peptidase [Brevundimonas sp.]